MSYARDERAALSSLLGETGPGAPTLCEGWLTRDLAAHLVLREHRPDAAAGLLGGPLAGHTRRVHETIATQTPYPKLVERVRTGPPALSLYRVPGMEERLNLIEFFVHHEDVRRASGSWEPRELSTGMADALWQRLRLARVVFQRMPVGVELVRDDLPDDSGGLQAVGSVDVPPGRRSVPRRQNSGRRQVRITAKARAPVVTVTGHPGELTLWVMGRGTAARVRLDGGQQEVRRLTESKWRV